MSTEPTDHRHVRKHAGGQEQDYRVWIGPQPFDPMDVASRFQQRSAAARQRRAAVAAAGAATDAAATAAVIVQFNRGLTTPDLDRLRTEYALRLDAYIPNLAFLERLTQQTIDSVRADFLVRACIALDPALKVAPWTGGAAPPPHEASSEHEFEATLFDDTDPAAAEVALAAVGARDVLVFDDREIAGRVKVHFVLDQVSDVSRVADLDEVMWIEPVLPITDTNVPVAIMQSGSGINTPVWDRGLHGEGQVIDVIDNGWPQIDHCFFADVAPNQPGPTHRKVVSLRGTSAVLVPASPDPDVRTVARNHASFVAGIAAGDQLNNSGAHPDRGGAWAAKLTCGNKNDLVSVRLDPAQPVRRALHTFLNELKSAKTAGAFIHSCSWRLDEQFLPLAGIYDRFARDLDEFTWRSEDHLVVCAAANSVGVDHVPPNNSSPGIAKNALCVGASGIVSDHGSGVAGPSVDGRRKPDLMAVGGQVSSAFPSPPDTCFIGISRETQTSWATPHAAAAAALVRQYFTEGWYPAGKKTGAALGFTPTGALLKAVLLNSTVDLRNVPGYPSDLEGWGLIQLDRALYFEGDVRRIVVWDVRHAVGLTPLVDIRRHELTVLSGAEQLKITLVWTERPPHPLTFSSPGFTAATLVNDLDLRVTAPDGTQYVGNDFTNDVSTPNGSNIDGLNNVEMVVVDAPLAGKWFLEVAGVVNPPPPDSTDRGALASQGYALVATGALKVTAP